MFLLQSLGIRQCQITVSWQCINDDLRPFVYAHHTIHAFSLIHSCFLLLDLSNVLNSFQPADLQSFKMSMRLSEMHSEGVCLCQLLPEMSVVVRIQNRVHGYKLHRFWTRLPGQSWFVSMVQDKIIWIYQPALLVRVPSVFILMFPLHCSQPKDDCQWRA